MGPAIHKSVHYSGEDGKKLVGGLKMAEVEILGNMDFIRHGRGQQAVAG